MCVNNLPKVAVDSGAAGIRTRDPLISSHCVTEPHIKERSRCKIYLPKWIFKSESSLNFPVRSAHFRTIRFCEVIFEIKRQTFESALYTMGEFTFRTIYKSKFRKTVAQMYSNIEI